MCTSCAFPNLGKYHFLVEGQISALSHCHLTYVLEVLVKYVREYMC